MNQTRPFRPSSGANIDMYDDQAYEDDHRGLSSQGYHSARKGNRSLKSRSDLKIMLIFDVSRSYKNPSTRTSRREEKRSGAFRQATLG